MSQCMKNPAEPRAFYLYWHICQNTGGWWGIRTPGGVAPTTVFKTAAFDRSANHPKLFLSVFNLRFCALLVLLIRMQDRHIRHFCQHTGLFILGRRSLPYIVHYFLRIANTKIVKPVKNIITDNSCPMVNPHDVRNPICASGARNCSQIILNIA